MDELELQRNLINEMRALLREVRAEREALFSIVIEVGHLPTLQRIAEELGSCRAAMH
ncbi:hypothetical protein [Bradyrhizobium sp. AUGA SZCCT0160]|uniref:hypothetical protein n=1 Tax=Bradyrhizobium sp. AUGA SZCCT0160 TaxID=2807662 RepID=UPI001BA7C1F5|nr:hypothetical protein [Bradyrhizobium sp. AUGA SZCCT0160]MBR1190074.1 hypothetical protein [Bradyrhizobium sp. AUGA SZCCT0160]